jgi:integrase
VDFGAARWTVPVARLKVRKRDEKKARPFVAPLPQTALTILRRLKVLSNGSPWVLASPKRPERPLGPKVLLRALTRLQADGRLALGWKTPDGPDELHVHDLRRTWRVWAEELGVDDAVAEKSLGHKSAMQRKGFSQASDVYARAERIEQRAQAAELVSAAFDRVRLGEQAAVVPLAERRPETTAHPH